MVAQQWYYTSQGEQKGPVDGLELKQLAEAGKIQPTDLVWTTGMPQWLTASYARGLFAAGPPPAVTYEPPSSAGAATVVPEDIPVARLAPQADRGTRPRRPQFSREGGPEPAPPRRKSKVVPITIIVSVCIFLLVIGTVILLVQLNRPAQLPTRYSVHLNSQAADRRAVRVTGGTHMEIRVTSNLRSNVDIIIEDARGRPLTNSEFLNRDPDAVVVWRAPRTDTYYVRVRNRGFFTDHFHVNLSQTFDPVAADPAPNWDPPLVVEPVPKEAPPVGEKPPWPEPKPPWPEPKPPPPVFAPKPEPLPPKLPMPEMKKSTRIALAAGSGRKHSFVIQGNQVAQLSIKMDRPPAKGSCHVTVRDLTTGQLITTGPMTHDFYTQWDVPGPAHPYELEIRNNTKDLVAYTLRHN
jgi:hypothetical protein